MHRGGTRSGFELDRHMRVVLSLLLKKHPARTLSPYRLMIDPASTRRQNYGSYSRYYPYRIATGWLQWPIRRLWLRVWSRRRRYPWNRPDRRCRSYGVGPNLTMHQDGGIAGLSASQTAKLEKL